MQNGNQPRNFMGWNIIFEQFFQTAGLDQTLKGFRNDMIVMAHDWQVEEIYPALQRMEFNLKASFDELIQSGTSPQPNEISDEMRLEWISFANNAVPSTPSQLNRTISQFIAQNRAKNNLSNRNEFLRKRRRVALTGDSDGFGATTEVDAPTCARTDAVPVNRDSQIKYDIAKNEHGPLARTVRPEPKKTHSQIHHVEHLTDSALGPGISDRFFNLEDHLAVRYVPSPPVSLLDRIRLLEDHVIRLERDYPPWAALHFKQPNRGWPPPPRPTPLIVPTHLTAASNLAPDVSTSASGAATSSQLVSPAISSRSSGILKLPKKKGSSLHRAVLEKLEVKRALAGED